MADRPLTYEQYKAMLAAGQKYVTQAQASDPEWQAWQKLAANYNPMNSDQLPTSPDKDYWAQYMGTLSPEVAADFQKHMQDSTSWTDKVGSVLKYAIPAAVGAAGLAGTGLLGTAAQSFVGGAPLGSLGGTAAAAAPVAAGATEGIGTLGSIPGLSFSGALPEIGASGLAPFGEGFGASLAASMGGALPAISKVPGLLSGAANAAGEAGGGMFSGLGSAAGGIADWASKNPGLVSLLGGLLATAGASSGQQKPKPQSQQFTPSAGMQFTVPQQQMQTRPAGILSGTTPSPYANSGLGRFGATGGAWKPWGAL